MAQQVGGPGGRWQCRVEGGIKSVKSCGGLRQGTTVPSTLCRACDTLVFVEHCPP